jgi:hypothetical protein
LKNIAQWRASKCVSKERDKTVEWVSKDSLSKLRVEEGKKRERENGGKCLI